MKLIKIFNIIGIMFGVIPMYYLLLYTMSITPALNNEKIPILITQTIGILTTTWIYINFISYIIKKDETKQ